ncbi:fungal specific transcription factor domain-containing protein [Trichoderma breve]|uniref:Fungal specific transcription factor domain-containing protein n=1 Tax=Trichoderma breve TaxID=2034170 RepID=A0A9W9B2V2_9HYPO|nr:fungal specific transcription factor domain-containing protein [Trichoderma breve]KAJ4854755.1 fungal specific transcription factor domain-containing protein [Trichoderma breve]
MESKLEFINLSHPSQGSSSKLQRRAYSHAARVSHARVKHARKAANQASNVEPSIPYAKKTQASEAIDRRDNCLVDVGPERYSARIPDPVDQLTSSRRDPFGCFARPLSPLEHYLFDHYITIVTTQYGSKCMILKDPSFHHHQLRISWIQLAVSNVGMLSTTFLSTCRHLHQVYQKEEYITLAMQYRILCIRAIREAIDAGDCSARDSIIATIISLTLDEIQAGNIAASRQHVRGLAEIVHSSGGPETLGMDGLLKHLFEKLAYDMGLLLGEDASPVGLIDYVAQGGINMPSIAT